MSTEFPTNDPIKAEALKALIEAIANSVSYAVDTGDIDREIPDDVWTYEGENGEETYDADELDRVRKQKIAELIGSEELQVDFIDREVEPMIIFEMVRFGRISYRAVSKAAIESARRSDPEYEGLADDKIAIMMIDNYYEAIYTEIYPEGDDRNQINVITTLADATSDKRLIKLTNNSLDIHGYPRDGVEQRFDFFVYDSTNRRIIPIILLEIDK